MLSASEIRYDVAPASRKIHLSEELSKAGINTSIVGFFSKNNEKKTNTIEIKQHSKNMLSYLLLLLHVQYAAFKQVIVTDSDFSIVRGCDMILFSIISKIVGRKIIYDFHGYRYKEELSMGRKLISDLTKICDIILIQLADYILVVSEGVKNELSEKHKKKAILLPNGVDPKLLQYKPTVDEITFLSNKYDIHLNKKIVGFVGNWEYRVKIEDILNAKKYLSNVQVLIVGEGHNYTELCKKYLDSDIIFTGRVKHEEAIKLMGIMDLCVIPYNKESASLNKDFYSARKTKEYILLNKPIIASNVDSRESLLKEYENTLLYEPGNEIDLAQKIKLLLGDKCLLARMNEYNNELATKITWDYYVKNSKLIDIITS